jgi:hypothetical protein
MLAVERYEPLNGELQEVRRMLAKLIVRVRRDSDAMKLTA